MPGIEIDKKHIITSDEAIHLPEVPKSIAIMGSGAVGVEFASIFRRFGSEVTLIELLPRIVPNEDEAVSAELEKAFRKRGIAVRTGDEGHVREGRRTARVTIEMQGTAGKTESLTIEKLLVATGRGPVTDGLGAAEAGLTLDRGFIKVDKLFRTGVAGHLRDRRRHHDGHGRAPAARALVVGRRHRARRAASRAARCSRSTTTRCPAARTASRRSAASA